MIDEVLSVFTYFLNIEKYFFVLSFYAFSFFFDVIIGTLLYCLFCIYVLHHNECLEKKNPVKDQAQG